jgi:hypothetical protein
LKHVVIVHRDFPAADERWYYPPTPQAQALANGQWADLGGTGNYLRLEFDDPPTDGDVRGRLAAEREGRRE